MLLNRIVSPDVFDADGASGAGLYAAPPGGDGFGAATPLFVPPTDAPFDGYAADGLGAVLATRCFDDLCAPGPENGIWGVSLDTTGVPKARKLPNLPYA